ncbi:hypothetical protein CDAR_515081 [Caerostris darwini]|uniref:Uncharacterized protein n=1 Tax=Caerostris darwini TaxID=1538125 RepID=A0AAV4W007_9ARAC|nr:hypothetical protein CDAR_515081 [Caerostris darwini]
MDARRYVPCNPIDKDTPTWSFIDGCVCCNYSAYYYEDTIAIFIARIRKHVNRLMDAGHPLENMCPAFQSVRALPTDFQASYSKANSQVLFTDKDPGLGLMMNTDIESPESTPLYEQGYPNDVTTTHQPATEHDILDMDTNKTDCDTNKNSDEFLIANRTGFLNMARSLSKLTWHVELWVTMPSSQMWPNLLPQPNK